MGVSSPTGVPPMPSSAALRAPANLFAAVPGEGLPAHLAGTHAAIFHLLKERARRAEAPRGVFRAAPVAAAATAARTARAPDRTEPPAPRRDEATGAAAGLVPAVCAELLLEDVFEFHPLRV
jgi:hypothetical protein